MEMNKQMLRMTKLKHCVQKRRNMILQAYVLTATGYQHVQSC